MSEGFACQEEALHCCVLRALGGWIFYVALGARMRQHEPTSQGKSRLVTMAESLHNLFGPFALVWLSEMLSL